MSCVENTNSIDLAIDTGMLEANLNVDPNAQNLLSVSSSGVLASLNGGWLPAGATLAYSSADSPTFVATTSIDLTGLVPVGAKFRLVQSATTLYFFVTAITSSTITLYGGLNYTLTNTTITSPYFSYMRTPIGFNTDPTGWTVTLTDTQDRSQSSPSSGTWYNPGSGALSLSIPIGCWQTRFAAVFGSVYSGAAQLNVLATLSTTNNSQSDTSMTIYSEGYGTNTLLATEGRTRTLVLASKTTYYLNVSVASPSTPTSVHVHGDLAPTIVSAICAYL